MSSSKIDHCMSLINKQRVRQRTRKGSKCYRIRTVKLINPASRFECARFGELAEQKVMKPSLRRFRIYNYILSIVMYVTIGKSAETSGPE